MDDLEEYRRKREDWLHKTKLIAGFHALMGAGVALVDVEDIQNMDDIIGGLFITFGLFVIIGLIGVVGSLYGLLTGSKATKQKFLQEGDVSILAVSVVVGVICFGFGIGVRSVFDF